MTRSHPIAMSSRLLVAFGVIAVLAVGVSATADAQGLVQGVQQGAREGNRRPVRSAAYWAARSAGSSAWSPELPAF